MASVFTVGEIVRLVGLVSRQSLNGAIGTVMGDADSDSRGRYGVQLQSPAAVVVAHPSRISLNPSKLLD
jgi:hypothetical protein